MLEKFKNTSLITKLLFLFAFILFAIWVIPTMSAYYSKVNAYEKSLQELDARSSEYGISTQTQVFSENIFIKDSELLFSKVKISSRNNNTYDVNITLKKDDMDTFHTFIETISLKYYVEIQDDIKFKSKDEIVNVIMTLKAF